MFPWLLLVVFGAVQSSEDLQTGLGMREPPQKRRPSESDRVTIDLSALRPSLPGLVLYEFGGGEGVAPKLVQVDLAALNPRLQPHVVWPQFNEMDLTDDGPFELDTLDAIPYLTEDESPLVHPRRMAKMSSGRWLDAGASGKDAYNFLSEPQRSKLLSLQGSLPLADEVIVPLDWEEKGKTKKRNVFLTKGWRAGGGKGISLPSKGPGFPASYSRPRMDRKQMRRRETESEERTRAQRELPRSEHLRQDDPRQLPSRDSWTLPRQYWTVPHLFGNEWH